ncbi:spermidine synthase [Croceicoccus mobilis]|uniref:Spermidine synthase n=1 Tax=Croceicoccus mobilis TaxID=1703339 RepID=A0A917DUD1_9SPHN|nr:spermidine synthase [Croceicoccus mobilis]GGD69728.1 spermidine synthase [Croceicoccus mobilis]
MLTRELLGTAQVPGGEELRLYSHGRDFMIVLDRNELMSTRQKGSEEALAVMSLERLQGVKSPSMLIGGYGMGFTLRAALAKAPPAAKITVAELVPEIIAWARGPMAEVADGCLDDPRVTVRMGDVADAIAERPGRYDAILLDVDNGPDGLVREENDRIYSNAGLAAAYRALTPDGVLAIWSAAPDPRFTRQLQKARFDVDEVTVHARYDANGKGKGAKHTIWFCSRREG